MTDLVIRICDVAGVMAGERVMTLTPAELAAIDVRDARTTGSVRVALREERHVSTVEVPAGWVSRDG